MVPSVHGKCPSVEAQPPAGACRPRDGAGAVRHQLRRHQGGGRGVSAAALGEPADHHRRVLHALGGDPLGARASASGWKGTRIDTINFKAIVNTTSGMIRLFLFDGTNTRLFREYRVSTRTKSSTEMAFELKVNLNFNLKADWLIKATIANSESTAIIAEANDWKYPS